MRKMKDSGIEWIGEIPESWATKKLSYYFKKIGSGTTPDTANGYFYDGEYNWLQTGDLTDSYITSTSKRITQEAVDAYSALTFFKKGAVVIAMYGATIGKLGILDIDCFTNQACCALSEPKEANSKFVYYWLLCNRENIVRLSLGGGQPNISQGIITSLKVSAPTSVDEQTRIVTYLDQKCAEIDAIIAAKEKTNELLKERRQSIIYEAVTKGLDPTVPMKDSGVEWIGEIPESWEIERLKYHTEFNPATDIPEYEDDQQVSFLPMECLRRGTHTSQVVDYEKVKKGYVIFQDNDILMAKVTPCLENGNIAIAQGLIDGIGFGSTEINVIRCTSIHREYLFYMLQCKTYIDRAVVDMYGVAGLKRLNPSFIPNTKYPIPSSAEQERIAEYLNRVCGEFDALIAANNVTIEKMKEYRQSVIYEAVTGKVEI
jgi:restriction endonuclease S subunit